MNIWDTVIFIFCCKGKWQSCLLWWKFVGVTDSSSFSTLSVSRDITYKQVNCSLERTKRSWFLWIRCCSSIPWIKNYATGDDRMQPAKQTQHVWTRRISRFVRSENLERQKPCNITLAFTFSSWVPHPYTF